MNEPIKIELTHDPIGCRVTTHDGRVIPGVYRVEVVAEVGEETSAKLYVRRVEFNAAVSMFDMIKEAL